VQNLGSRAFDLGRFLFDRCGRSSACSLFSVFLFVRPERQGGPPVAPGHRDRFLSVACVVLPLFSLSLWDWRSECSSCFTDRWNSRHKAALRSSPSPVAVRVLWLVKSLPFASVSYQVNQWLIIRGLNSSFYLPWYSRL
jgi:hypothetical protein